MKIYFKDILTVRPCLFDILRLWLALLRLQRKLLDDVRLRPPDDKAMQGRSAIPRKLSRVRAHSTLPVVDALPSAALCLALGAF